MKSYRHDVLPSVIWEYHFNSIDNKKLLEECYEISKNDGRTVSNVNGYQSNDIDITKHIDTEIEKLYQNLRIAVNEIAVKEKGKPLDISNFWININPKGGSNSSHVHPHSVISGTYYVNVPEGDSGNICFYRERSLRDYISGWIAVEDRSRHLWQAQCYKPIEGSAIIFTSNLEHSVGINNTEELRVSIAFNTNVVVYN